MTHEYRHPFPISVTDLLTIHMPAAERLLGTKDLVVLPSQTHLIVQRNPNTTDRAVPGIQGEREMENERGYVRALIVPKGEKKDSDGREFGDDHMLADLGESWEGATVWLTTDYVHTSEFGLGPTAPLADAAECGLFMAAACNFWLGSANDIATRVKEAYFAALVLSVVIRWAR